MKLVWDLEHNYIPLNEHMHVKKTFCFLAVIIILLSGIAEVEAQLLPTCERPKVGLVLSGGAAKGIAHVGVIKVLEEVGIPVDFVAGTSMGSVVGGMYAVGYDAETMEEIVLRQNWNYLLSDNISRKNLSVEEKEEQSKYFVSFPVKNFKIKLPSGLGEGQNVSMLLSRLAVPVHHIEDFSNFYRPFVCIATDIVTGEEVVLDHGYLPDAIRASMAIPTLFSPIEINGHWLVDGGLVNNFPADRVKEMGADIIIGVNLGFKPYGKEELTSINTILEQSLFFQSVEKNKINRQLCDILIEPQIEKNNAASFEAASVLIEAGEEAARNVLPELKKMASELSRYEHIPVYYPQYHTDSLHITKLEIEGLKNVTKQFLLGKLRIPIPSKISIHELEGAIERIYGTLFFNMVTYKLVPLHNDEVKLIIRVNEKETDLFRVGAHYDSDFSASLLLNTTLRNVLGKGTKFTFDVKLGDLPGIKTTYLIHTGWKPTNNIFINNAYRLGWLPDIGLSAQSNKFEIFTYNNGDKIGNYNYTQSKVELFTSSNITNSFSFRAGFSAERSKISGEIITDPEPAPQDIINYFLNTHTEIIVDSWNRQVYPSNGIKLQLRTEFINDIGAGDPHHDNFIRLALRSEYAVPVGKNSTILWDFHTGATFGDSIPDDYQLFVGGKNPLSYNVGVFPFTGLKLLEKTGRNAMVAGLNFQYEIADNHFVVLRGNAGKVQGYYEDIFSFDNIIAGFGFTYGYKSLFGPIEITVSRPLVDGDWFSYINIGYSF